MLATMALGGADARVRVVAIPPGGEPNVGRATVVEGGRGPIPSRMVTEPPVTEPPTSIDPADSLRLLKEREAALTDVRSRRAAPAAAEAVREDRAYPAGDELDRPPARKRGASNSVNVIEAAPTRAEIAKTTDPALIHALRTELQSQLARGALLNTYRYLRLVMVGAVLAIGLAVWFVWQDFPSLPSISHYYYTPARIVFAGALVAATAALLALSGRGGQRAWLDIAAFFAPLIALIPTHIGNGEVRDLNECEVDAECIPDEAFDYVATSFFTWAVFVVLILAFAIIRAVQEHHAFRQSGRIMPRKTFWQLSGPIAFCAVALVVYVTAWSIDQEGFLRWAHLVSASLFFFLITIVAWNQVRSESIGTTGLPDSFREWRKREMRWIPKIVTTWRGLIALALLADIVAAIVIVGTGVHWDDAPVKPVFLVEAIALILFAVFWIIETILNWDKIDPN